MTGLDLGRAKKLFYVAKQKNTLRDPKGKRSFYPRPVRPGPTRRRDRDRPRGIMSVRDSAGEALHRQLDSGKTGSQLHAVLKARQWVGASSLINGACCLYIVSSSVLGHPFRRAWALCVLPRREFCALQAVGATTSTLGGDQKRAARHHRKPAGGVPRGRAN